MSLELKLPPATWSTWQKKSKATRSEEMETEDVPADTVQCDSSDDSKYQTPPETPTKEHSKPVYEKDIEQTVRMKSTETQKEQTFKKPEEYSLKVLGGSKVKKAIVAVKEQTEDTPLQPDVVDFLSRTLGTYGTVRTSLQQLQTTEKHQPTPKPIESLRYL